VALAVLLSGCVVTKKVSTANDYLLLRRAGERVLLVSDEDPLQERFREAILSDPYLAQLLSAYNHVTDAFDRTNYTSPRPDLAASLPVLLLNSATVGPVRDLRAENDGQTVPFSLVLGLGVEEAGDLAPARAELPALMAGLLLEVVGVTPSPPPARPALAAPTTATLAFHEGFAVALEALHARARPEVVEAWRARAPADPAAQERLERYEAVPRNALRQRADGTLRPRAEALCTPGVVATFFYRLLLRTDEGYPQPHLLWFWTFQGAEIPLGKVLLAVYAMPRARAATLEAFMVSYGETFPAERAALAALAEEVLGP
jgi:hypothetical protein